MYKSEVIKYFASSSAFHHTTSFVSQANFQSFISTTGAVQTNSVTLLLEEAPGTTVSFFSSRTHYARDFYFSLRISYILSILFYHTLLAVWFPFSG